MDADCLASMEGLADSQFPLKIQDPDPEEVTGWRSGSRHKESRIRRVGKGRPGKIAVSYSSATSLAPPPKPGISGIV